MTPELEALVRSWAPIIDAALRESAGQRNPSEWFKKEGCWNDLRDRLPALVDPLPPELTYGESAPKSGRPATASQVSAEDYDRIVRCMGIDGGMWLEIAERGQRAGLIHWKVAGICRTLAGYAAGGWQRKPPAKQAKPALDALRVVQEAGLAAGSNAGAGVA